VWFTAWQWLQRRWRVRRNCIPVVLYTREGCHLCQDALAVLRQCAKAYPLQIEEIDVDQDPHLAAEYGEKVPVIAIDGRPRLWGRPNAALLRRLLRAREGKSRIRDERASSG
jgi:glutaredoxin